LLQLTESNIREISLTKYTLPQNLHMYRIFRLLSKNKYISDYTLELISKMEIFSTLIIEFNNPIRLKAIIEEIHLELT
jgi:hypothetical protein